MKPISPSTMLFALTLLLASCHKESSIDNQYEPIVLDTKTAQLVTANNAFGLNAFKEIAKAENNIFISPLSISQALGMVFNGADGETAQQMKSVLGYADATLEEVNQSSQKLRKSLLQADQTISFSVANSIWYSKLFSINSDFVTKNQIYYDSETQALDFSKTDASKKTINSWVNDHTNGKIPSIIDEIRPEHVMFLINAVYFKGQWKYKFEKSSTSARTFYNNGTDEKQVEMMTQETDLGYYSGNGFSAAELPYGNGHFSMVVLLPNEGTPLASVVNALTPTSWATCVENMQKSGVRIFLPKIKQECDLKLNDCLMNLGMGKAFSDEAEFPHIGTPSNLKIDEVKHKTFVEVSEEGTEAAAVTSIGMVTTSFPPGPSSPIVFDVNRPYIYAIIEKDTQSIVFIGQVKSL